MFSRIYRLLAIFSFFVFAFCLGMWSVQWEGFPSQVVQEAHTALNAYQDVVIAQSVDEMAKPEVGVTEPTVRNHAEGRGNEFILVSGGPGYRADVWPDGCLAWLMDRDGRLRHYWKYDPQVWSDLKTVNTVPVFSRIFPVGMHLDADGALLVNYQGHQCFPYGVGMARFDKDSNLLWRRELLSHHWFSVAKDGRIFVPALKIVDSPLAVGRTEATIRVPKMNKIVSDYLLILDPDGNVLDEISMLEALFDSGWQGLIWHWKTDDAKDIVETGDPTHLNDVQLVDAQLAARFPWLNEGDLLVSFRNINAIGILDIHTKKFKWMTAGSFVHQHSPRFFGDGVLLIDNLGGDAKLGGTRIVKLDLERPTPSTVFPHVQDQTPQLCRTELAGYLDINRDGNRILFTLTQRGTIWEIDLNRERVLWEYIYTHPRPAGSSAKPTGKGEAIQTAEYVYDVNFPLNLQGEQR